MINFITQEEELKKHNNIYAFYFYASWLNQHKKMLIMCNKACEKFKDLQISAINVDIFKSLCSRFGVSSVPTIIIFNNGKEINRLNGICLTSAFMATFLDIYSKCSLGENNDKKTK